MKTSFHCLGRTGRSFATSSLALVCSVPICAQAPSKYRTVDIECDRVMTTGTSTITVRSGPLQPVGVFTSLNSLPAGVLPYYDLNIGPIGLDPFTLVDISFLFPPTNVFGVTQAVVPTAGFLAGTQVRLQAGVPSLTTPGGFAMSEPVVRVVQSTQTNLYAPLTPVSFGPTRNLALGDVDADGDDDVYACGFGVLDQLYLSNGNGTYTLATPAQFTPPVNPSNDAEFVDLNSDNVLDIVAVGSGGATVILNTPGAGGTPTPYVWPGFQLPLPPLTVFSQPSWNAVDTGDVDADGDIDFLVGAGGSAPLAGAQNQLFVNQFNLTGTALFLNGTALQLPTILDNTEDVEFADVDADGDLDAFVANFYCLSNGALSQVGWQDYLLLNSGTGVFTPSLGLAGFPLQSLPPGVPGAVTCDNSIDCEFGDVDNDGDLDLVVGNWQIAAALPAPFPGISYEPNRLYLNNGFGAFTLATANLLSFAMPTNEVEFLDYDRDGDLDLLEVNGNFTSFPPAGSPPVRNVLLQNNGAGVFTVDVANTLTISGLGGVNAIGAEVGDMAANRHNVDIVIANVFGGITTFLLP